MQILILDLFCTTYINVFNMEMEIKVIPSRLIKNECVEAWKPNLKTVRRLELVSCRVTALKHRLELYCITYHRVTKITLIKHTMAIHFSTDR